MEQWLSRTEMLLGKEALLRLKESHVLVAGLGGVGSWAAEMICRAGIGAMTIIDGDTVTAANKNRQLPALTSTTGRKEGGGDGGEVTRYKSCPEAESHPGVYS